jgi:NAD(P)-dependent dehydrogenase (short-subunit alcohol dehydrogenase family)
MGTTGETSEALRGRVAVVTGSGRGIGADIAVLLADHGADVALCSQSGQGLDEAAGRCRGQTLTAALEVAERLGPASVVVNNAAVLGPVGPLASTDPAEWAHALLVNVAGVANGCRAFQQQAAAAGGGSIVNLSGGGIGGPRVAPRISAYTASKAAVVALTETLALELAEAKVRVNAVAPGAFATGFNEGIRQAGAEVAGEALYHSTLENDERPAPFDDLARLLLYLVSPDAAWLTGRLLSARWDSPEQLEARRADVLRSSLFQLRRIDGDLFLDPKLDEAVDR